LGIDHWTPDLRALLRRRASFCCVKPLAHSRSPPCRRLAERFLRPLALVEPLVDRVPGDELLVRALAHDPPLLDYHDPVGLAQCREAVSDHQAGAAIVYCLNREFDRSKAITERLLGLRMTHLRPFILQLLFTVDLLTLYLQGKELAEKALTHWLQ
jgi:hypothetical protein